MIFIQYTDRLKILTSYMKFMVILLVHFTVLLASSVNAKDSFSSKLHCVEKVVNLLEFGTEDGDDNKQITTNALNLYCSDQHLNSTSLYN
jgi:hypothetical protein